MSEVEKQESQKTIVAFVSGLLIGGLLVWVFSPSPEKQITQKEKEVKIEEVAQNTEKNTDEIVKKEDVAQTRAIVGEGSVIVASQPAGSTVTLTSLSLPTEKGWVVIREFTDGVVGNILGAARYSIDEGLIPNTIELVRATSASSTYQVVFFTNEGDALFNLSEDTMVEGIATTFETK